jgi:hypothetical protein
MDDLPPLPRPDFYNLAGAETEDRRGFSVRSMDAYARAAIASRDAELVAWQKKGDCLMADAGSMFRLGEWWADRPWRKK